MCFSGPADNVVSFHPNSRADGYGRAEGAGALYLKRLDDAIRDGDVIRAVIRSSAVNSNGKVPGYGITFPNADGQEKVVRQAYQRAGLDPNQTAYFECHGTGTPVGDPIEVRAVAKAMNDTRPTDAPLLLGAIKPNIGHSEAASGIFAIIKAALMVEKGLIPGVAGLETINPNIHESDWNVKVNRDLTPWPAGFDSRRASVSSFGYGGTNAHVIVENVEALVSFYRGGQPRALAAYDHATTRPLLLTMSAHDKTTLARNITAHAAIAKDFYLHDLVHTLSTRRTALAHGAFAIVNEATAVEDMGVANFRFGPRASSGSGRDQHNQKLIFIFTGQGAQWIAMGRAAIAQFPAFRATIRRLEAVLRGVPHAPTFSIEKELCAPPETSRIADPEVAQSTLAALQIAIVDLLASWGVEPAGTIGHSAGESAAAYAAGLVSAPEVMIASYYRGYALAKHGPSGGSMLAVGKGVEDIEGQYRELLSPNIVVACQNSPQSVTLSGPVEDIHEAQAFFTAEGVFARELKTGMPYHSPYMLPVSGPMEQYIAEAYAKLDDFDRQWRFSPSGRVMISTVSNKQLAPTDMGPGYWISNLLSPVLFSTGVPRLIELIGLTDTTAFVEVGPHSALAGPFKQICQAQKYDAPTYIPTIVRSEGDACLSLLKTAGELWLAGYPIDLTEVNRVDKDELIRGKTIKPQTLTDLPPYQWNYEKMYWAEPRASAEYRQLTHARHDLLGRRILGLSDHSIAWRNVLRTKDVPWLEDHKLGGSLMVPSAGYLAMAIEAVRQHGEINNIDIIGVILRDVELKTALIVPETDGGIEIQVRLTEQGNSSADGVAPTYDFAVESVVDKVWTVHSSGIVIAKTAGSAQPAVRNPVDHAALTQRHSGKRWNESFHRVGFEYTRSFAALDNIRTHGKYEHQASGKIPIQTECGLMQGESRYLIHPATVDALLQLVIIAIHGGRYQEMPWGVVPIKFDEVTVMLPGDGAVGSIGEAVAWLPERGQRARHFSSDAQLTTEGGQVVLDIKGLRTVAYEAALPPRSESELEPMPFTTPVWKADPTGCALDRLFSTENSKNVKASDAALQLVELFDHKQPLKSLLVLDSGASFNVAELLTKTSPVTKVSLIRGRDAQEDRRLKKLSVPGGSVDLGALGINSQDLDVILLSREDAEEVISTDSVSALASLLGDNGKAVLVIDAEGLTSVQDKLENVGLESTAAIFSQQALLLCSKDSVAGAVPSNSSEVQVDLVYSSAHSAAPEALSDALRARGVAVHLREIQDVQLGAQDHIVLYNPDGSLLTAATSGTFEPVKTIVSSGTPVVWLTSGGNEGSCPAAATVAGFLRVVREEQQMAKASVLDHDKNETVEAVASILAGNICKAPAQEVGPSENEVWLHNGICHISRVVPHAQVNERMIGSSKVTAAPLPREQLLQGVPEAGEIHFRANEALEGKSILSDEVDIQVLMLEFDRSDLQALPTEPRLAFGVVFAAGDHARAHIGKTVLTYTSEPYNTVLRAPSGATTECDSASAANLIRHLPVFCSAINALGAVTGSLSGKEVLLLSDPSSAMSRAMASLSRTHGFTLRSVAHSYEVARQLVDNSASSLVVIAEDFSSVAQDLWREVPAGSTFIVSGGSIEIAPDALPFSRGARFCVSSLTNIMSSEPSSIGDILAAAIPQVDVKEINKSNIFHIGSLGGDEVKSTEGRGVVIFDYDSHAVKMVPSGLCMCFSSDDIYFLVGCLGGLGRSLTSWMMDRGAKHFAFLSRSGADKPEAAKLVEDISHAGAHTYVIRGDASRVADVQHALDVMSATGRRVAGVVHAAMVLNDGMLPNMTLAQWQGTMQPKVDGANAIAEAIRISGIEDQLDFFVMTSSISATAGQPGQANYAAANAYLDGLARARHSAGLVGTALVLPMVLGVGVVAESDSLESMISRRGLYGVDEREMLRGFAAAMSQPRPCGPAKTQAGSGPVIVMGLEPPRIGESLAAAASKDDGDVEWMQDARFAMVRALAAGGAGQSLGSGPTGGGAFAEQLAGVVASEGYDKALQMTASHIMQKCSAILLIPVESIELDGKSVGAHGLDSMIGVELRNWLFKELRLNIAFQELLSTTLSFKALSQLVLANLGYSS